MDNGGRHPLGAVPRLACGWTRAGAAPRVRRSRMAGRPSRDHLDGWGQVIMILLAHMQRVRVARDAEGVQVLCIWRPEHLHAVDAVGLRESKVPKAIVAAGVQGPNHLWPASIDLRAMHRTFQPVATEAGAPFSCPRIRGSRASRTIPGPDLTIAKRASGTFPGQRRAMTPRCQGIPREWCQAVPCLTTIRVGI
jgi:hypothetical protein